MLSFTLLTLALLYVVALGNPAPAPAGLVKRPAQKQCNRDNCYNVLTNTPAVASSFCSTFLQPTTTITITPTATIIGTSTITPTLPPATTPTPLFIPSHISSQCTLTTSPPISTRLSSACSCISVVPVASTVTVTAYAPTVTRTNPCEALPNPYTVGGDTFDLYCGYYQYGNLVQELFNVPDLGSCIGVCTNTQGCIGVSFIEQSPVGYVICSVMVTLADYGNYESGFPPGYAFAVLNNQTLPSDFFTPCGGGKRDVDKRCIG